MKISCIYLATGNLEWLINTSILNLIKNTDLKNHSYEIIIVFNGFKEESKNFLKFLSKYSLYYSDPLWTAKGYNLGAQYAKGEYLAFFHDDSTVKSPYWLDIALEKFIKDPILTAISSEYGNIDLSSFGLNKFKFLKCTPLIIKKNDFFRFGRFDENYLFGFEDIDFSFSLTQKGAKINKINFDYEHHKGSSTVSIFGSLKDFYKEFNFINLNVVNAKYFANKHNLSFNMFLTEEEIIQLPDLETLNKNKKDFADLIKANYFIKKNKPEAAKAVLDSLHDKYKTNFLFQKISEKLTN